jgi:hypothetical protein
MEALQINVHLDKEEHNNPPTLETQVLNTALSRLIAINKDFTRLHAIAAISEIEVSTPTTTSITHSLTSTVPMARP